MLGWDLNALEPASRHPKPLKGPGGGVYDHVTAMIGCHGGHMIGKLPNALGTAVLTPMKANMWPLSAKAHPPRG